MIRIIKEQALSPAPKFLLMDTITIIFIALGLAMDAFAVSISAGFTIKKQHFKNALIIALYFGVFQAVMPIAGWLLGSSLANLIFAVQHWVASAILLIIGIKMIIDSKAGCEVKTKDYTCHFTLLGLAIATSIDAFTIGVSFSLLHSGIIEPVIIIGIITFFTSFAGVYIGKFTGCLLRSFTDIFGGIILILIALKIIIQAYI